MHDDFRPLGHTFLLRCVRRSLFKENPPLLNICQQHLASVLLAVFGAKVFHLITRLAFGVFKKIWNAIFRFWLAYQNLGALHP